METKDIIAKLRKENNLSQSELADKLFVTRQAVSRWENGKTVPNNETLVTISKLFNVSVNALLGSEDIFCQSCGMPLSSDIISVDEEGKSNEDYCKFCYHDGKFTYNSVEELIERTLPLLVKKGFNENQAKNYLMTNVPSLRHWK